VTDALGRWVHGHPDLLLGLALIGLAFAIGLAARICEVSREVDAVLGRRRPDEPPVDEWAAELEDLG
jgi:hypothetical protein